MEKSSNNPNEGKFNLSLKSLIIVVILVAILYFLVPKLLGIEKTIRLLKDVNPFYLAIGIIFEVLSYCGMAVLLGVILSRLGYKINFKDRFRIGSIAAFAIHFFPVGSFGQGAVDFYFLTKKKVAPGSVLIMFILRMIMSYSAFLIIFVLGGLLAVPSTPNLPFSPKLISAIFAVIVFGGALYLLYLSKNKEKFWNLWKKIFGFGHFFIAKVGKQDLKKDTQREVFEDIYQGVGTFTHKKRNTIYALLASATYWLGDILCFYFVFLSFGYSIPFGVLIFGYGIATLAGLISFIPGGLGVTEGSMALIFSALGVPSYLAMTSILVFRFFSFWIWIPVGLISYFTLKRGMAKEPAVAIDASAQTATLPKVE